MSNDIRLTGALNFRDLGGYRSAFGGNVKTGVLFRSDSLVNLTEPDITVISDLNVRTVIDLRTEFEIAYAECSLKKTGKAEYINIPLIDDIHSKGYSSFEKTLPASMGELYRNMLDNSSAQIVSVFETILKNSANGIVFNCTAGKDRTGVIAALMLDLLGVDEKDIIEDYTKTQKLMEPTFEGIKKQYQAAAGKEMPAYLLEAKRESIEEFLAHLYEKFGGAKEYLKKKGFGKEKTELFINTYIEFI